MTTEFVVPKRVSKEAYCDLLEAYEARGRLLVAFREEFVESFMEHLANDRKLATECLADFEAEHA